MPGPGPQWTDFLSCEVCYKLFSESVNRPISLGCGHTVCKLCLSRLQQNKCPFDQSAITCDIDKLPVNYALLQLIGAAIPDKVIDEEELVGDISDAKKTECYESARKCIEELAVYLKPLSEDYLNELEKNNEDLTDLKIKLSPQQPYIQTRGGRMVSTPQSYGGGCVLSRPMQRKLLVLINCQLVEEEGRSRAARAARSLGERSVTELILAHQNPQQLSANLWAAVRTRGCQFLGPGMQEEVLRLILLALEDGSALSRKVLVLFVVQRLEKQYPQASKTAIGHVVQLLYRASCFKVTKREEESSLMQLKEEFRTYEALRLEHDAQIVQIAMEAGLRISPEQWSSLLYGDATHKSHMQSIIDKHQSPQSFTQGINELVLVLQRLGDPSNLCRLRPHLDFLAKIDPSPECPAPSWEDLEAVMKSLKIVVQGLVDFVLHFNHRRLEVAQPQNTRYKTSMCRDFMAKGSCPRGATCTFAHSQEELEQYRCRSKKLSLRGGAGGVLPIVPVHPSKPEVKVEGQQSSSYQREGNQVGQSDSNVGTLASTMAALSLSHSTQPPGPPDPRQSPGMPHCPTGLPGQPGPTAFLARIQQALARPQVPCQPPYPSVPSVPEGMRGDQQSMAFPGPLGMRFGTPTDRGLHFHNNASVNPVLPQPLPGRSPGASSNPTPTPPAGVPPLPEMMVPPGPCPHQRGGEPLQPGGPVYPMSVMMGGPVPPFPEAAAFMYGPGGDLHPAVAGPAMPGMQQTLEKLQNRKSELISHLQCEQGASGTGLIGRTKLDRVLSTRPRLSMDPLSSTVNDTFVAMRTTNTLDELNTESLMGGTVKVSPMSAVHTPPVSTFTSSGLRGNTTTGHGARTSSSAPHQMCDGNVASTHYMYTQPANSSSQASERGQGGMLLANDVAEDGDGKDSDYISPEVLGIVKATLEDEDDFFIPFDPPLVSKFGPISRLARTKGRNTDPVQVTAEENMMRCTPVLSVTPLERPFPTSAPVPSMYKPQMTPRPATPISLAAALQPPPAGIYSPWSGQDFWRWQIPEMVQKLEKSAIQANSTSERLALQLQAVELQISMKTGENPKPVSQLLHEASPSNGPEHRNIKECMGRLYGTGEGGVHVQTRGEFVPSDQKWK